MTTTYVPLKYAKKAMREVREESLREGERRGYARATEFVRMASTLNGSTHAVLKALQEEHSDLLSSRGGGRAVRHMDGDQIRASEHVVAPDGDLDAVLKALQEEGDAALEVRDNFAGDRRGDVSGRDVGGGPGNEQVDLDAVLMAALDALAEAKTHHPETDGGPVYAYLAGLLADPEALADALAEMDGGEVVGKSFDESKHPRGDNGRFIGREQIHAAKSDPKLADELRAKTTDPEQRKKLEAALKGDVDLGRTKAGEHRERVAKQRQDRQERVKRAQELANDISMWRRGGEAVPASHFRELAEVLPSMTVAELRSVRGKLAASFGGDRRKAEMAARLLEHAKNKAALLETNEKYEDMDALDFGSLHEYQNEGNAKGNEARNPNPEEQHGGRMQQRHDLMGAGAKGELQAPGKLSHGTPDTGSVLKLGDKPAPPPQAEPSKLVTPDKPDRGSWSQEPSTKQPHEMTADEYERSKQGDTYGDWYFTPDGKYIQMRGSGGMGSERVGALDVNGKHAGYYNRSDLKLANKSPRSSTATDAADDWLKDVSEKVADLKQKNEKLLLGKKITDTFRSSLASGKMTQEQFDKAKKNGTILSDADYAKAEEAERQIEAARNTPLTVPENKQHRAAVEAALATGKPVPLEVLKDYPDLAAKYGGEGATVAAHTEKPTYSTDKPEGGATVDDVLEAMRNANKPKPAKDVAAAFKLHVDNGRKDVALKVMNDFRNRASVAELREFADTLGIGSQGTRNQIGERLVAYAVHGRDEAIKEGEVQQRRAEREKVPQQNTPVATVPAGAKDKSASAIPATPIVEQKTASELSTEEASAELEALKNKYRGPGMHVLSAPKPGSPEYNRDDTRQTELMERLGKMAWQRPRDAIQRVSGMPPEKHRKYVEQALAAGKTVPPEVLADYPDLAKPAASDTPLSPAVHDAVKSAVKHHKRMQMPGKPVPQMVVYHIPEHRNTGGQLIEPAKVNAVPVNSYTGEQLLSGKLPHLKIEGTFEVGADGTPKRVEGADFTKSINDAITSTPSTHGDARFIHHVYDAMRQKNPSLTRDEFNRQLIDAHKRRDITLSRLDMPQGHATADIQAARVPHMNAEFHFVEPNGKRATQTKAIPSDWDDLRAELAVKRGIVHDDGATGV